jgi:hypothetical protein
MKGTSMKRTRTLGALLAIAALAGTAITMSTTSEAAAASPTFHASPDATETPDGVTGRSIEIDPTFPYYQGRSAASIADELVANGYTTVHYFVVNENNVDGELIDALHARHIFVWALVLGNGSYSVAGWPSDWPSWSMGLVKPPNDGFYRFSPWSNGYVAYKKAVDAELVSRYRFDGFEMAESYLPEWNGLESGVYGDVGPNAQAAFAAQYPQFGAIPNFTDPEDPHYYQTDTARYEAWQEFRVQGVDAYQNEIINGAEGVRAARPGIKIGTWSLAINVPAGSDAVAMERERQGIDAASVIAAIRPDIHFLQSNWPDWMQANLPPTYVEGYKPFVDEIRASNSSVPIGVQADIGSTPANQQSRQWVSDFENAATATGFAATTAYEYFIGDYMYTERPKAVAASCSADDVRISFQKRVDPNSIGEASFTVYRGSGSKRVPLAGAATVDGSVVTLPLASSGKGQLTIRIADVADTPSLWLRNQTSPANVVAPGSFIEANCKNGQG